MAQYDLTPRLAQHLDRHLVFPLLEFLQSKGTYDGEDIERAKVRARCRRRGSRSGGAAGAAAAGLLEAALEPGRRCQLPSRHDRRQRAHAPSALKRRPATRPAAPLPLGRSWR